LEISDLGCARGDRMLFEELTVQVNAGALLHVAGSNGSGKTTLLRTLCGLSRPAVGAVQWQGQSIRTLGDEYRRHLVYVGHLDGIQGELTPIENLRAHLCAAAEHEMAGDAADAALERLGVAAYRAFPTKMLSQGQKRRVALARLLTANKRLWILDEPFTALDARSCRLIEELLAQHIAGDGIAVISSHQEFDMPRATCVRIDLDDLRAARPYVLPELATASESVPAGQRPA
jgi:heme exporter protein A